MDILVIRKETLSQIKPHGCLAIICVQHSSSNSHQLPKTRSQLLPCAVHANQITPTNPKMINKKPLIYLFLLHILFYFKMIIKLYGSIILILVNLFIYMYMHIYVFILKRLTVNLT